MSTLSFKDLTLNSEFYYRGKYYIKTSELGMFGGYLNAIRLSDKAPVHFPLDTHVSIKRKNTRTSMLSSLFSRFWADDNGFLVSSEMSLISGVITLGVLGGMIKFRDTTLDNFDDITNSIKGVTAQFAPSQGRRQSVKQERLQDQPNTNGVACQCNNICP
jgi:Flp pilus assembly pilin Flp